MAELYLLSRLGVIHNIAIAIFMILFVAMLISFIMSCVTDDWTGEPIFSVDKQINLKKLALKLLKASIIFLILIVVTPTTKEAYTIYGVGGTLDYLQSNEKAKQLPDKCIEALDLWVENLKSEESDNNN